MRDQVLARNVATAVQERPRVQKDRGRHARTNCWTAIEARSVLKAADAAGAQVSAWFALLLDSGMRKSEALGLQWSDVDLDAATVTIAKQLDHEHPVTFGVTKTGRSRVVTLGAELGTPCTALAERYHRQIIAAAGVRAITPHGMRHTCATLLLGAGVPVQVVAQRLGHAEISMTVEVYAHSLPDMQRDAAARLSAVLAG